MEETGKELKVYVIKTDVYLFVLMDKLLDVVD